MKINDGGGVESEDGEIEVLEIPFNEAIEIFNKVIKTIKTNIYSETCLLRLFPILETLHISTHLRTENFHLGLFPGLYDHPLQRYSLDEKR